MKRYNYTILDCVTEKEHKVHINFYDGFIVKCTTCGFSQHSPDLASSFDIADDHRTQ